MGILHNKKASFREHLDIIISYAQSQGMNKTELCEKAGIELKRLSDFKTGRKTFTGYYFMKLLGGLGLNKEEYEKKTGGRFSENQRRALKYQQFVESYREKFSKTMDHPKLLKQVMALIDSYEP